MKLFVIADVHGFYDEMIEALENAGFDKDNPNHMLIGCGDYWDRGKKPYEVTQYLSHLKNKVLVRGNHEDLMDQMLARHYSEAHDIHNGTEDTFYELLNHCEDDEMKSVHHIVAEQMVDPFFSQMVDYYETKNYIFVHGYIPTNEDWKNGNWESARWSNGFDMARFFGNKTGKTIVFGHWHTSYGHYKNTESAEWGPRSDFSICYFDNDTIGIDGCTAYTGKVNVLVLEDELLNGAAAEVESEVENE